MPIQNNLCCISQGSGITPTMTNGLSAFLLWCSSVVPKLTKRLFLHLE